MEIEMESFIFGIGYISAEKDEISVGTNSQIWL